MKIQLRKATPLDISGLLSLLAEMATEGKLEYVNWEKVCHTTISALHHGVVYVGVNKNNQIVGSIGGVLAPEWYTDVNFLADMWNYVLPIARKSTLAKDLLLAFKEEGLKAGYRVQCGHIFGALDIARKDAFFERNGFTKKGSVYEILLDPIDETIRSEIKETIKKVIEKAA